MKTLFIVLALAHLTVSCFGATALIPDIPVPKLSASEAIAIAGKNLGSDPKYVLISTEWSLSSKFQPSVSDGTQYHFSNDDSESYCWFLTYLEKDQKPAGQKTAWTSVRVIRIKNDGTIGVLIGTRT